MTTSFALVRRVGGAVSAIALASAVLTVGNTASAASVATVPLASAANYSVLGASTVTNTGATVLHLSLGLSPGTSITGFPPGLVIAPGTTETTTPAALQAQTDLTAAYVDAAGRSLDTTTSADLVNLHLTPGVYAGPSKSPLSLSGPLVLDGGGDLTAVFIFQTNSTLTTASSSSVTMVNGAQECNVFWQVGSSATLGTNSVFAGNILALTSVTVTTGATVHGRALARNAAVTLDTNTFTNPTCDRPISAEQQAPVTTVAPTGSAAGVPDDEGVPDDQDTVNAQPGRPGTPSTALTAPPTSLAFTGQDMVFPLLLGAVFLGVGAAILRIERLRKLAEV